MSSMMCESCAGEKEMFIGEGHTTADRRKPFHEVAVGDPRVADPQPTEQNFLCPVESVRCRPK